MCFRRADGTEGRVTSCDDRPVQSGLKKRPGEARGEHFEPAQPGELSKGPPWSGREGWALLECFSVGHF